MTSSPCTIEGLYQNYIKQLSAPEQLRLIALISQQLALDPKPSKQRSLLELAGLGAELWEGIDAQEYVATLRAEWEQRL